MKLADEKLAIIVMHEMLNALLIQSEFQVCCISNTIQKYSINIQK